jgi:hypothetical protein
MSAAMISRAFEFQHLKARPLLGIRYGSFQSVSFCKECRLLALPPFQLRVIGLAIAFFIFLVRRFHDPVHLI